MQGRLQCLGSTSRLKLRFGGGYLLEVHAPDDEVLQARLAAFILRELGGREDEERHLGYTKYRLPAEGQVRDTSSIAETACHRTCLMQQNQHLYHGRPQGTRSATSTVTPSTASPLRAR